MGDPIRALQLKTMLGEVKKNLLLENAQITGNFLLNGLEDISVSPILSPLIFSVMCIFSLLTPKSSFSKISRVRGLGTFIAFDFPTQKERDTFLANMKFKGSSLPRFPFFPPLISQGVNVGGCGESSVRLRPMLIFAPQHAQLLLDVMREVIAEMK